MIRFIGGMEFEEVLKYYRLKYYNASDFEKIILKCWLYVCECVNEGGQKCMSFKEYVKESLLSDNLDLVNRYVIDCSDVGGRKNAVKLLMSNWFDYKEKYSRV